MRQSGKQQHGRTRLAHRNSMTGECSTARGGSGTVIRHYFPARTFPAPAPVAPLTLGMTVPAASRVLIPTSRRAQRFASGEAAAARSAVLLCAITARADEHMALTPRTQKQSDIVHRSPRRGGLDDPRSPGNTALGAVRKCGSGRSLGRDRQVNSVRGCVGLLAESDLTPTPERRHRGNAPRRRALLGHIGSGRIQRQLSGGDAGTTQSMFTPLPADPAQEGCSPSIRAFTQPSTLGSTKYKKSPFCLLNTPTDRGNRCRSFRYIDEINVIHKNCGSKCEIGDRCGLDACTVSIHLTKPGWHHATAPLTAIQSPCRPHEALHKIHRAKWPFGTCDPFQSRRVR